MRPLIRYQFARAVCCVLISAALLVITASVGAAEHFPGVFDVRQFGAAGDGNSLDTAAINRTIQACAAAGGGKVLVPPGRYLSGTVHLQSNITLWFDAGATLIGTTNLNEYRQPRVPEFLPEAKWGKWHRALLVGESIENVTVCGPGTIDGNKVFDPTGEEQMRGPHTIAFVNCRNFTIRDLSIRDSANYAIFFQVSDRVEVRNVNISGGWDGVHFRGGPDRPCQDVNVIGCRFFTGDDALAGRYWRNVVIADCKVNSSCNGIRLIGPATQLTVRNCLFYGPGVHPHRTSNRNNMLSGINLQPGGWDPTEGSLEDVLISNVTMRNVASPLMLSLHKGNTADRIRVDRLTASGVYRAAISAESYGATPIQDVTFHDLDIEFEGGGTLEQGQMVVNKPGVDARPLPAWAVYLHQIGRATLEDAHLRCAREDFRPLLMADSVEQLVLNNVRFPTVSKGANPLVLRNVKNVENIGVEVPAGKRP